MKSHPVQGRRELQNIIQHIMTAQKTLLIAGFSALMMSPMYLLSLQKLSSTNLQYTAVWFLCVLSLYLIYVSLEYKRILQKTRQLRLEKNFLRYHATEEPFIQSVQYAENIWANSELFKLARKIAFPEQKHEFAFDQVPTSAKLKNMTASKQFYRTFGNPDLEHSFEMTFGKLCPSWLNYSLGFLICFVWLLIKFNERVPSHVFEELIGWYYVAWIGLAGCFVCEMMGVYFRYQAYLEFPDLKTELLYLIATIISTPTQEKLATFSPTSAPHSQVHPSIHANTPAPEMPAPLKKRAVKRQNGQRTPQWEAMIDEAEEGVKRISPEIGQHLPAFHPKTWVSPQKIVIPTEAPRTQSFSTLVEKPTVVSPEKETVFVPEPDTLTDYTAYASELEAEPTTEELVWTGLETYIAVSKEAPPLFHHHEPQTVLGDETTLPTFSNLHQLVK